MSIGNIVADRHLRPAHGLTSCAACGPQLVRIVVSPQWAASAAGQLLVSSLINLLCRQVALVHRIELVSPDEVVKTWLPGKCGNTTFPPSMVELARWAVADEIPMVLGSSTETPDCIVVVGDVGSTNTPFPASTIFALGDGWRAWVGTLANAPKHTQPKSSNPLGPFLAASLAAGEVFKRARGITRGRYLDSDGYSLWSGQHELDWSTLVDGPEIACATLGPLHIIGAGAVGNNAAYILASAKLSGAYVVAIDDDTYDFTNLNRCLLAGHANAGYEKVYAVSAAVRSAGLDAFPYVGTIRRYLSDARPGLRREVNEAVNQLEFTTVLSCVDKGASRQHVQGLWPKLLLGGSTIDLSARTDFYGKRPGAACLACYNAREKDGDRVRELEKRLRNMEAVERAAFCARHSLDVRHVNEYLSGVQCGGLGEAALRSLASQPPSVFSVGFVSLGASLLLVANLFRQGLFASAAPDRREMTILNYLNGGMLDSCLAPDPHCEMQCEGSLSSAANL